ncbi:MAG: Mfa1 fimbrilin C-terminal domain-containing protein [Duncaniella sp.]|nr:Mfa1 fimbrilin C-terminal domain-containing protein [Duncaniella sp.]
MKRSIYLSALALLLAGCSSEEPIVHNPDGDQQESASSFITIRMMSSPTTPLGRADDEVYENGTIDENNVQRVRFYFFDGKDAPFGVHRNTASGTYDSYIDWYPTDSDIKNTGTPGGNTSVVDEETVEKVLTATLGINLASTEKPAKVLAVINPTEDVLGLPNSLPADQKINGPSLSDIRGVVTDYLTGRNSKAFVMSNSVYLDGSDIVYTTELKDEAGNTNFAQNPQDAAANPVIIYVERVLARFDLGLDADFIKGAKKTDNGNIYLAGTIEVNDSTSEDKSYTDAQIYVKLLGWNVTRTTSQSRLVKEISKTWGNDILGTGMPWNTTDFHRSFWAINPDPATNKDFTFRFGTFGNTADATSGNFNPAQALSFPTEANKYTFTYMQENAAPFEDPAASQPNCSQVIVAAQLVDPDGKPLTLAEWGYKKYTLTGLKNQLAKVLNNLCSVTEDGSNKVYTPIKPDQLTFQYADPIGEGSTDKNYWVYAVLTPEAAKLSWQIGTDNNGTALATSTDVNKYIRDMVNHVMIWNGGLTYYYFNIRHLGLDEENSGYCGVVRNHIYRSTITSINGLGVPVYDPGQIIIPETSAPDDFIIAADLRVLQWRVVSQNYELKWE